MGRVLPEGIFSLCSPTVICVCSTQIQTLQQEKEHLSQELEGVYQMHHEQLELQQLQHYQVRKSSFRHELTVCGTEEVKELEDMHLMHHEQLELRRSTVPGTNERCSVQNVWYRCSYSTTR